MVGIKTYPRQTPFGYIVRIVYSEGVLSTSEILFDLYLEGKFPFQPPKLVCESILDFPSFSDGRDLIFEMLKKKWTPSITSADLIGMIPNFFQSVLIPSQKNLSSQEFGQFHLSSPYYLESWERKSQMSTFYCTETTSSSQRQEKILVLTHTTILILDLNPQYPGIGFLVSWATIQSLNSIRRSIKQNDKLTLEWKQMGDNSAYTQVLTFNKPNEFIELLSKNMQKNGATIRRLTGNKLFKEDEVNGKAIKSMNINEILQAIEVYEDNFESTVSPVMVNTLLELYQRAIEYFAAIGSSQYNIFLKRMQMILSNESVVNVMQGKNEEKKIEKVEKKMSYLEGGGKNESIEEKKVDEVIFSKKIDIENEFLDLGKVDELRVNEDIRREKENLNEKNEDDFIIKPENKDLNEKKEELVVVGERKNDDVEGFGIIDSEINEKVRKVEEDIIFKEELIESQLSEEKKLENSEHHEFIEEVSLNLNPIPTEEIKIEDSLPLPHPESELIPPQLHDSNLAPEKPNS